MRYSRFKHKLTVSEKELKKAFSSYWDYIEFIAHVCVEIGIPLEEYLRWIHTSDSKYLFEAKEDEQKTVEKEV